LGVPPQDGAQTVSVYRAAGEQIVAEAPVSFGADPQVTESGQYTL
jgi:hypothetical protein